MAFSLLLGMRNVLVVPGEQTNLKSIWAEPEMPGKLLKKRKRIEIGSFVCMPRVVGDRNQARWVIGRHRALVAVFLPFGAVKAVKMCTMTGKWPTVV